MKTSRFAAIVGRAGAPRVHPLWLPPERDADLQQAIREERVMTVHQDVRGTRQDFGTVGFAPEPEAQFLVFPGSLAAFAGTRVVGIDYNLLQAERPDPADPPPPARKKAPGRQRPAGGRANHGRTPPSPPADAPAQPPPAAGPSRAATGSAADLAAGLVPALREAITDLRAGRAVAAYERLQALVARLEDPTPPAAPQPKGGARRKAARSR